MPELLTALDAFLLDHRRCGDLDGGVEGECLDGMRLWGCYREATRRALADDRRIRRGLSEEAAFRQVLWWILMNARSLKNGGGGLNRGHAHPCDEAADLMRRYPAYRASWAECTR
jgi:hypothetical protein